MKQKVMEWKKRHPSKNKHAAYGCLFASLFGDELNDVLYDDPRLILCRPFLQSPQSILIFICLTNQKNTIISLTHSVTPLSDPTQ